MPGPRVVEISWSGKHGVWFCPKESRHEPSGLLRANKESRAEYLRKWSQLLPYKSSQLARDDAYRGNHPHLCMMHNTYGINTTFESDKWLSALNQRSRDLGPVAYFNPELDTIYVGLDTHLQDDVLLEKSVIDQLSRLSCLGRLRLFACEYSALRLLSWRGAALKTLFGLFPVLRHIDAVWGDMTYQTGTCKMESEAPITLSDPKLHASLVTRTGSKGSEDNADAGLEENDSSEAYDPQVDCVWPGSFSLLEGLKVGMDEGEPEAQTCSLGVKRIQRGNVLLHHCW